MENMGKVEAVCRMQDFINEHLNETITMYMLANAAGYSPWHCARIFKELTGKSPFEYIRHIRLSKAAVRLRDDEVKVIDVALEFVFNSHEGFTRAFSAKFGISPYMYSKKKPPIELFIPYRVGDKSHKQSEGECDNMSNEKNVKTIFVQVVERPERKVILRRGIKAREYFEYCEEVGCDVWDILCGIKEALYEPIGMWLPETFRPEGTSTYVQGVEVPANYSTEVPEGFEIISFPACKMMIFQGQPYDDERFGDEIGIVMNAIKDYDPEIYGFKWADEDGPRFQFAPQGYRGYIEGKPVRMIQNN